MTGKATLELASAMSVLTAIRQCQTCLPIVDRLSIVILGLRCAIHTMRTSQQQQRSSRAAGFSTTTPSGTSLDALFEGWESQSVQSALDECARELGVRERVYCDWVESGKLDGTAAADRIQRMCKACQVLSAVVKDPGLCSMVEQFLAPAAASSAPNAAPVQKQPF
jgi:hypothetical protein